MGITLSHSSALTVLRTLRVAGVNVHEMDETTVVRPSTWVGKRWTKREFEVPEWHWPQPTRSEHLHVLTPKDARRIRMSTVDTHMLWNDNASQSALWVDARTSIVRPELLFLQMAEELPLPALVMLGYELCGNYSRDPHNPMDGAARVNIPTAMSVKALADYLAASAGVRGVARARRALASMSDNALSPMEALLATVYSLPPQESGYGMGPITLNARVAVGSPDEAGRQRSRYPDLSFSFAPIGINYDGEDHLDLAGIAQAARTATQAERDEQAVAEEALRGKLESVRAKVVDDNRRNRQLAASGKIVFPATKEDVYGWGRLDELTWEILRCAESVFDVDVEQYSKTLDDSDRKRDRYTLLSTFLPSGTPREPNVG